MFICPMYVCMYVCMYVFLTIVLCATLSFCTINNVCLSVCLSVCQSDCMPHKASILTFQMGRPCKWCGVFIGDEESIKLHESLHRDLDFLNGTVLVSK